MVKLNDAVSVPVDRENCFLEEPEQRPTIWRGVSRVTYVSDGKPVVEVGNHKDLYIIQPDDEIWPVVGHFTQCYWLGFWPYWKFIPSEK